MKEKAGLKSNKSRVIALVLFICFTVGAYTTFLVIIHPLQRQRAALIQLSDDRILTQNVFQFALHLVTEGSDKQKARAELSKAIQQIHENEQRIADSLEGRTPRIYGTAFQGFRREIDPLLQNLVRDSKTLLSSRTEDLHPTHPAFTRIETATQDELIPIIEQRMAFYDRSITDRIVLLQRGASVAIIGILLSVAAIVGMIIHPLFQRLKADRAKFRGAQRRLAERSDELQASRQALDHQLRISESLLNSIGDGAMVADNTGKVLLINPSGARILSRVMSEFPTEQGLEDFHSRYQFLRPDKVTALKKHELPLYLALKGKRSSVEGYIRNPLSPERPEIFVTATGTPLRDKHGTIQGGVVVFRDSTEEKRAFEQIQSSERRYRSLLEGAAEVFYQCTVDGRISALNQAFEQSTGFKREDWIGKNFREMIHPEDLERVVKLFEAGVNGEKGGEVEFRIKRADGTWGIISASPGTPVFEGKEMIGIWGFSRDITIKRKTEEKLRESEELILRAFSALPGPIGIATLDGRFIHVNERLAEMVGLPIEKVVGARSIDLGIWSDTQERARMIGKLEETGLATKVPLKVKSRDGNSIRTFEGDFQLIQVGGETCVLGLLNDVTEAKIAEKKLREAKMAADTANRAKSAFLANISHEIRTPLSAICGYLEMLDGEVHAELKEPKRHEAAFGYMSRIKYNIKTVIQLIDDLLDISKIEAGKLDIEKIPFPLLSELAELLLFLRTQAESRNLGFEISLDTPIPSQIKSDPMRLRQLVMNVVGNAIKFTSIGSVKISLGLSKGAHPLLTIAVQDTGCGIPEEKQAHLFKPFVQADSSTTRRFGGTGLGLSLSRKLAHKLGGDLLLEKSAPGKGSRFLISIDPGDLVNVSYIEKLDLNDLELSVPRPSTSEEGVDLSGIRVLLVEDGPDNQRVIRHFLMSAGAHVDIAANGRHGIQKAQKNQYDVILMDLQMPVMGGYEATEYLRKEGHQTPIVALTAAAMKDEREQCLRAGCNDYLTKPFEVNSLLKMVKGFGGAQALKTENAKEPIFSLYQKDPRVAPIVKGFVSRLPERMSSLRKAFSEKDWAELKKLSHQIKGAAGGYGYPVLTEAAAKIESAALEHDAPAVESLLNEFGSYCERADRGLRESGQA